MEWINEGANVVLTAAEYGALQASISNVEARAKELVQHYMRKADEAEDLLKQAVDKEALINVQRDLTNAVNRREDDAAQIVREAEHFMQEVYHRMANVSRTERSSLVKLMDALKPRPR